MMGANDWIAIVSVFLVNGGLLFAFFLNMNVKIAEINERYIALQKEVSEHKDDNKDSFNELKNMFSETEKNNRQDHGKLFDKFDKVGEQVMNATRVFLKNQIV